MTNEEFSWIRNIPKELAPFQRLRDRLQVRLSNKTESAARWELENIMKIVDAIYESEKKKLEETCKTSKEVSQLIDY